MRGKLARVAHAAGSDVAANVEAWQLGAANVQVLQQAAHSRPASAAAVTVASSPKPRKHRSTFAATTWVVNTTDDLPDANPGDKICATSAGTCSLRAAIDEGERRKGDDVISFNIPGGAPQTIALTSTLTA